MGSLVASWMQQLWMAVLVRFCGNSSIHVTNILLVRELLLEHTSRLRLAVCAGPVDRLRHATPAVDHLKQCSVDCPGCQAFEPQDHMCRLRCRHRPYRHARLPVLGGVGGPPLLTHAVTGMSRVTGLTLACAAGECWWPWPGPWMVMGCGAQGSRCWLSHCIVRVLARRGAALRWCCWC
jgi:hypothetical protein